MSRGTRPQGRPKDAKNTSRHQAGERREGSGQKRLVRTQKKGLLGFFDAEILRRVSATNECDGPNDPDEGIRNTCPFNANVEKEESKVSALQDAEPSANEGISSASFQNQHFTNSMRKNIAQKLKDVCDADHFKNLSMVEEDNSD